MYTKNVHHGNVIHTVYTICLQKVYYQCSNFGKGCLLFCELNTRNKTWLTDSESAIETNKKFGHQFC